MKRIAATLTALIVLLAAANCTDAKKGGVPAKPHACTALPAETRAASCPEGYAGIVTETRVSTCPGPVWGEWTVIASTCEPVPPPAYRITLAWDANPPEEGIEGYRVYMGTASGQYGEPWSTPGTEMSIGGLQPGVTYYFAATAYRGDEESGFSDEVKVLQ